MNSQVPGLEWLTDTMIDADCPDHVREGLGFEPLLDSSEITGNLCSPVNYRSYKSSYAVEELAATRAALAAVYGSTNHAKLDRFDDCRKMASFFVNKETGKVMVLSKACHDRWCPFCARSRARDVSSQVSDWLKTVYQPRFLTLTLKSSDAPLGHQIDSLYKYFRAFRKLREVKAIIKAGLWFFQITVNQETGQYHPHIHCLIVGKWVETKVYSDLWKRITKHSFVVDIRKIEDQKQAADYVGRYVSRPAMLKYFSLERQVEIIQAFAGRRLFGTWGPKNIRPKIVKKTFDGKGWVFLKSWLEVVTERKINPVANAIWNAWSTHEPLPDCVLQELVSSPPPPPRPPPSQPLLFGSDTRYQLFL